MAALATLAASVALAGAPHRCAARAVGPGTLVRGGTSGADCLFAAFRGRCKRATYTLSAYGVDTIAVRAFRTRPLAGGRCGVVVVESMRVVPQPAHETGRSACYAMRRTATDVVVARCTPGGTVSLTRPGD